MQDFVATGDQYFAITVLLFPLMRVSNCPTFIFICMRLGAQFLGGGCRLFRIGGVLLGRLIHLLNGGIYLFYPLGLLV